MSCEPDEPTAGPCWSSAYFVQSELDEFAAGQCRSSAHLVQSESDESAAGQCWLSYHLIQYKTDGSTAGPCWSSTPSRYKTCALHRGLTIAWTGPGVQGYTMLLLLPPSKVVMYNI